MQLKRTRMVRFLPGLLAILAMLVAACGTGGNGNTPGKQAVAAPKSQQNFRIGLPGISDIATFDPGIGTDAPSIQAIQMVFTGLVQLNDQLQVVDQLAESHDVSSDGLTYTFHLRSGLKFSDGTPLNANDAAYSIDRALSPAVSQLNGVTQTYLGLIKDSSKRLNGKMPTLIGDSIKVVDDHTLVLIISQNAPYFLEALTYPTAFVVEKSVIDKWGAKWTDHLSDNGGQGGDGPFKVASYSHAIGISFVPNPNYYGPQPQLQKVELDFYKTSDTSYSAYQAGQVEQSPIPPAQDAQAEAKIQEFHKYSELVIDFIAMNYLAKPFDNIHIREAFALSINKDAISKAVYNGLRMPTCHMIPEGMSGYNANLKCPGNAPTKGNPTLAKQLFLQGLQEEGLTLATLPPIKITYPSGSPALDSVVTTERQEWQQVLGVTVTSQVIDFNTLLTQQSVTGPCTSTDLTKCQGKGMQMWIAAWGADYPDPQDWTTLQFNAGAPNNYWNYGQNLCSCASEQQAVQQELVKADGDLGSDRMALYQDAEQKLVNDIAWIPTFQRTGNYIQKPYVIGWVDNAIAQTPPNDWGKIYIAVH